MILTDWLLSCLVNANLRFLSLTFHPKLKEFFLCTQVIITAKFWHSLWMIFTLISLINLICLWKSCVAETRNVPVHIIICLYLACIRLVVEYCMPLYHSRSWRCRVCSEMHWLSCIYYCTYTLSSSTTQEH